jgi:hypothetical protein
MKVFHGYGISTRPRLLGAIFYGSAMDFQFHYMASYHLRSTTLARTPGNFFFHHSASMPSIDDFSALLLFLPPTTTDCSLLRRFPFDRDHQGLSFPWTRRCPLSIHRDLRDTFARVAISWAQLLQDTPGGPDMDGYDTQQRLDGISRGSDSHHLRLAHE